MLILITALYVKISATVIHVKIPTNIFAIQVYRLAARSKAHKGDWKWHWELEHFEGDIPRRPSSL